MTTVVRIATAAAMEHATKRGSRWQMLVPVLISLALIGVVVAMALAAAALASDPMAGT